MKRYSCIWYYANFDSLEEILKNGLKIELCNSESYDYLGQVNMCFQRVRFVNMGIENCNIQSWINKKCYIGFNDDWVNRNDISPVIYCRENGRLTDLLKQIMAKIDPFTAQKLCPYCKQFGDLECDNFNNNNLDELCCYGEQEWRYIPKGYSEEYLKFTYKDVSAIYVTSINERIILGNMFPQYIGKIKVIGEKKKSPNMSEF